MNALKPGTRAAYATAYARPGRMRAGWAYFVAFLHWKLEENPKDTTEALVNFL